MYRVWSLFFVFSLFTIVACAQDAVPIEILKRTWLIKNDAIQETGTGFVVDHKGAAYLITARHMVRGLPATNATIEIKEGSEWKPHHTVKTLFPKSDDVDIAVLKLNEKVPKPFEIKTDQKGAAYTFGQQVWFLGYPYQMGTEFGDVKYWGGGAPFIKRGTMSAVDVRNKDAVVFYIDGFNNPGFSGGPIVYWDIGLHKYEILGVVKGYREETAKVLVNGQHMDTQWLVNSGILIAYSIKHANEAIEADDKP